MLPLHLADECSVCELILNKSYCCPPALCYLEEGSVLVWHRFWLARKWKERKVSTMRKRQTGFSNIHSFHSRDKKKRNPKTRNKRDSRMHAIHKQIKSLHFIIKKINFIIKSNTISEQIYRSLNIIVNSLYYLRFDDQ